jgi:rhamnosyltransferase subunit B
MDFLLTTIGSHGDAHPFIGLGAALHARGHEAKLMLNEHFVPLAQSAGLQTIQLGSDEEYRRGVNHPDLWHGHRAFAAVMELVKPILRMQRDLISQHIAEHPETIVVGSSLCLGARIAQDKLGFTMATVHLSPAVFRSVKEPAKLPGLFMPRWFPRIVVRKMYDVVDRFFVDPVVAPPVNELRKDVGLAPVNGIFRSWMNSPDMVIGMFPEWYAPPAPDWPQQTVLTGFPLWDECDLSDGLAGDVYEFLNAGDAPIVFTPGSANWNAHAFFDAAVEACTRIGARGILLSRHREHIPSNLPASVKHFDFIPFSQILPRAAAVVHHGGIGSCSQALAAGTRQLVMPMAHDQLDNAARLSKLGVAKVITPRQFRGARVAQALNELLDDRNYQIRAHWVSQWFKGQRPMSEAVTALEELAQRRSSMQGDNALRAETRPEDGPALVGNDVSSQQ